MEKGDVVKIYEDPITKTKVEGNAKLLKLINKNIQGIQGIQNGLEYWKVKFLSDEFVGYRFIG